MRRTDGEGKEHAVFLSDSSVLAGCSQGSGTVVVTAARQVGRLSEDVRAELRMAGPGPGRKPLYLDWGGDVVLPPHPKVDMKGRREAEPHKKAGPFGQTQWAVSPQIRLRGETCSAPCAGGWTVKELRLENRGMEAGTADSKGSRAHGRTTGDLSPLKGTGPSSSQWLPRGDVGSAFPGVLVFLREAPNLDFHVGFPLKKIMAVSLNGQRETLFKPNKTYLWDGCGLEEELLLF